MDLLEASLQATLYALQQIKTEILAHFDKKKKD